MNGMLAQRGLEAKARAFCAPAEVLAPFGAYAPDVVVINSVVQYFPSASYLHKVMTQSVSLLAKSVHADGRCGGKLLVGDVRNHGLLRLFHSSIMAARAKDGATAAQLRAETETALGSRPEVPLF